MTERRPREVARDGDVQVCECCGQAHGTCTGCGAEHSPALPGGRCESCADPEDPYGEGGPR